MSRGGVAAVLSFFVSGLGQIYNGQILKGLILFVIYSVCWIFWWLILPLFVLFIFWLYGIVDAYRTGEYKDGRIIRL